MPVEIVTSSTVLSATPTLAVAGTYASGDSVGTLITFTQASTDRDTGVIQHVTLVDLAKQNIAADIIFFSANPSGTTFTDNGALDIADADMSKVIGHVSISSTDYCSLNDNSFATKANIGLVFKLTTSNTLYAAIVTRGAPTYTSGDITLEVGVLRD